MFTIFGEKFIIMSEKQFKETQQILEFFKTDLKALIKYYSITVDEQCDYVSPEDDCNGVGTMVKYLVINGDKWYNDTLDEILDEIFKLNNEVIN
jgi:hypothetical protein